MRATGSFADGRITLDAGGGGVRRHRDGEGVHRACPRRARTRLRPARQRRRRRSARICRRGSACRSSRPTCRWRSTTSRDRARTSAARALLKQSTVEGATLDDGTTAEFKTGRDGVSYGARGSVTGLNVRRVGKALRIAALDKPAYDGTLNGDFDVDRFGAAAAPRRAAGESRVAEMTLDAKGTLTRLDHHGRAAAAAGLRNAPGRRRAEHPGRRPLRGLRPGDARQSQGSRRQRHRHAERERAAGRHHRAGHAGVDRRRRHASRWRSRRSAGWRSTTPASRASTRRRWPT